MAYSSDQLYYSSMRAVTKKITCKNLCHCTYCLIIMWNIQSFSTHLVPCISGYWNFVVYTILNRLIFLFPLQTCFFSVYSCGQRSYGLDKCYCNTCLYLHMRVKVIFKVQVFYDINDMVLSMPPENWFEDCRCN